MSGGFLSVCQMLDGWRTSFLALDADVQTNILLTFITAVIALANIVLVRDARKAHRMDLRAYITAVGGTIEIIPNNENQQLFKVQAIMLLKNQGRTPAYSFRTYPKISCGSKETPDFNSNPPAPADLNSSIIGSGESVNASLTYDIITKEELIDLWSGKNAVFLSIRAEYKDAFGKKRFFLARCINGSTTTFRSGKIVGRYEGVEVRAHSRWDISPHKLGYEGD